MVVKTSAVAVKPSGADIGGRTAKRGRYTSFQQRIEGMFLNCFRVCLFVGHRSLTSKWNLNYLDLKAYKEKHGHLNVKMDDDLSLYQFCTK